MNGVEVERKTPSSVTVKTKTFPQLKGVYEMLDDFENDCGEFDKKTTGSESAISPTGFGGARPKQPAPISTASTQKAQTKQFPDITIDQIQYEAIKNLIDNKLLERLCTTQQMTDKIKICFMLDSTDHNSKFEDLYQKIVGLIRYDLDISSSDLEKGKTIAQDISKEFSGVFCKCCSDKLVIIGDNRDVTDRAKNKANVKLKKVKPSGRSQRHFTINKDNGDRSLSITDNVSPSKQSTESLDFQGNRVTVKVYNTDITKLKIDVVVNAANGQLEHYGGVAYFIAKAAGDDLNRECHEIIKKHDRIPVSNLAVTSAGRMPCKKVFHAVGPSWHNYSENQKNICLQDLLKTILRCLCAARDLNMTSIAIPSISSGKQMNSKCVGVVSFSYSMSVSAWEIEKPYFI